MRSITLLCLAVASVAVFVSTDAFAGRNVQEFDNPNFNNRKAAYAQQLQEATDLRRGAQERRDALEDAERNDGFLVRSAQASALQQAEDAVFNGNPGDQGSGIIGGQTYSWMVTATNRIFNIDGEVVFDILCDGGC